MEQEEQQIGVLGLEAATCGFSSVIGKYYEYYLVGIIKEPEHYVNWFHIIRNASPNDQIKIYINSNGGDVNTAIQWMRVLSETEAHVTCSIEGSCMSAATMIFLCADVMEVTPFSLFMVHNYSGGVIGKGGEIYDQAVFERTWSNELLHGIYKDFLTEVEINQLLDNKDIWINYKDLVERCTQLCSARQAEAAKAEDSAE